MPPNPSHLEAVDPVLNGMARAAATSADQPGAPIVDKGKVLAILIHGDAAFPGQGVVAETLNLSRLDGYDVGGIIHLIANNQLGLHDRSRRVVQHQLCQRPGARLQDSDHARQRGRSGRVHRSGAAGDCVSPALQARLPDRSRRLSHATATTKATSRRSRSRRSIRSSPRIRPCASSTRRRWSKAARSPQEQADALVKARMEELERAYASVKPEQDYVPPVPEVPPSGAAKKARTAVAIDTLQAINSALMTVPEGFTVHRKLERGRERRKAMFASPTERSIDWAAAEELAHGHHPRRRRADPLHRRRRRARHLQPSPRRLSRCGHRRRAHPAAGAAAGEGVVRDSQQPAVRIRVRRLRARLQPAGACTAWCCGRRNTATSSTARRSSSTST